MKTGARRTMAALLGAAVLGTGLLVPVATSSAVAEPAAAGTRTSRAAGEPACTVVGTRHADRLVGTRGRDVICGRGGKDTLVGAGGDDVLRGGSGRDRLAGGAGDDDLDGGPQPDVLDGGPGANACVVDAADTAARCVYDRAAPSADQLSVSTAVVDVTEQDQSAVLRLHVTDDTGADLVRVRPGADGAWVRPAVADLVSGNERDGWWEATVVFRRYAKPGTFRPQLEIKDRVGHWAQLSYTEPSVEVRDDNPDLDPPVVTVLSPGLDESVDVRESDAQVAVRVHIADPLSGVHDGVAAVHLWAPSATGMPTIGSYGDLQLESGDLHDGIWAATVRVPRGAAEGRWNMQLEVSDAASFGSREAQTIYWGPDLYPFQAEHTYAGRNLPLPDGAGVVNVVGRSAGHDAPTVSDVVLSTDQVDTLTGPATVEISFRAVDVDGADGGYVALVPGTPDSWPGYTAPYLQLVDGTVHDGVWRGTVTLPQGLEPGVYYAEVSAVDRDVNQVILIAAGHPYAQNYEHVLPNNPTVTVVDHTGS